MAPNASVAAIRAAHDREADKYTPEKVAAMAPEFRELAERHSRDLDRALAEGLASAPREDA